MKNPMNAQTFIRKLRGRLAKSHASAPPYAQRRIADLPADGMKVSVEKALNSRCTSDDTPDTTIGHWGMFDTGARLSDDQLNGIVTQASVPRLTELRSDIRRENNLLSFIVDPREKGIQWQRLMIECGMRQQAFALVCAALGVGTVLKSLPAEAKRLSDTEYCAIRLRLDPMKPSYHGSFWTTASPGKERAWRSGNLPDPRRDGPLPLLTALQALTLESEVPGRALEPQDVGQILWAAKGRTPHFYKSIPWGMTVPTARGQVEITSVFVCDARGLFRYSNWETGRPTHSLREVLPHGSSLYDELRADFPGRKTFVLFRNNASSNGALWEIGYCLLNALLQSAALRVSNAAYMAAEHRLPEYAPALLAI